MAKKGTIRSIRFSDEMIELIEQQAGENFTAKFEALVTRCIWELPAQEKELKRINEDISRQKKRLQELRKTADKYQQTLDNMKWDMQRLGGAISRAAEACNTD